MVLILMAVFVLVGMGVMTNEFASSGVIDLTNPSPVYSCDQTNYLNCQIPVLTGCAQATTNCQVGGSNGLSNIFNPQSPFTALLSGNFGGFLNDLNPISTQVATAPFSTFGGPSYFANIYGTIGVATSLPNPIGLNIAWPYNNQININLTAPLIMEQSNGTAMTASQAPLLTSTNSNVTVRMIGGFPTQNPPQCLMVGTTQQADAGHPYGYFYWGCYTQLRFGTSPLGQIYYMIAMTYDTYTNWIACQGNPSAPNPCNVQASVWFPSTSMVAVGAFSPYACRAQMGTVAQTQACETMWRNIWSVPVQASNGGILGLGYVFGLVAGVVLLLIGLGLGVGAGGFTFNFSLNPNNQGTRLAEALGFALVVFLPMQSIFGAWISSALLGSVGLAAFVGFFVDGSLFFGIIWQVLVIE